MAPQPAQLAGPGGPGAAATALVDPPAPAAGLAPPRPAGQGIPIAEGYAAVGVTEIVALRGDPPRGTGPFTPPPEGFASSVELIAALAATGRFTLRVGAYPERHPDSADTAADIEWLRRKIDAGASSAITQFFFKPETFFRFRDACARAGITAPIIPGILPVENWAGVRKFAAA